MSTFLVTGGAGFIGSHVVHRLAADGHRVRVLDDFSTGKRENLRGAAGVAAEAGDPLSGGRESGLRQSRKPVELVEGSVLDGRTVLSCVQGADYVLHQAAIPSVSRSLENPSRSMEVNSLGTLKVLEAARKAAVKRVVIASSSSVYGGTAGIEKKESMMPKPCSVYAASKLAAEQYAIVYGHVYGLEVVVLRYFNVFGPRQDPDSAYAAVIPRFIRALTEGRRPEIYGDGNQSRDFTYVENVVQANLLACRAQSNVCGGVYNIGTGTRQSILGLAKDLNRLLHTDIEPVFCPARLGDVRHSLACVDRARQIMGYRPAVSFREGLARTVDSYRIASTVMIHS